MMYWGDGMGWWMVFGGIFGLIFLAALIALVVWGINRLPGQSSANKPDPLSIAKERYARGEISKEEFENIKKNLS